VTVNKQKAVVIRLKTQIGSHAIGGNEIDFFLFKLSTRVLLELFRLGGESY